MSDATQQDAPLQLVKGQKLELNKLATPGTTLNRLALGLSWDPGKDTDLDATALGLNAAGKLISNAYVVGYPNALENGVPKPGMAYTTPCGGITHTGDNRTGDGDGDDETIKIDLSKLNPEVDSIIVLVDIYDAKSTGKNFGQVEKPKVRVLDQDQADKELAKLDLGENASDTQAIEFCRIYRYEGERKFDANWKPYAGSLTDFINSKK